MRNEIDFNKLWKMALSQMERIQNPRYKSLFLNHEQNKERLCRKLGIVSAQDVVRLTSAIEDGHK